MSGRSQKDENEDEDEDDDDDDQTEELILPRQSMVQQGTPIGCSPTSKPSPPPPPPPPPPVPKPETKKQKTKKRKAAKMQKETPKKDYSKWGTGDSAVSKKKDFLRILQRFLKVKARKCGEHARFFLYRNIVEEWNKLATEKGWFLMNKMVVKGKIRTFKAELKKYKKEYAKGKILTVEMIPKDQCPYADVLFEVFYGDAFLHHIVHDLGSSSSPASASPPSKQPPPPPIALSVSSSPSARAPSVPSTSTPLKTSKRRKQGNADDPPASSLDDSQSNTMDPFLKESDRQTPQKPGPLTSSLEALSGLATQLVSRLAPLQSAPSVPDLRTIPAPPAWTVELSDIAWPILHAARIDETVLLLMTPDHIAQLGLPLGDVLRLNVIVDRLKKSK